MMSLLNMYDAIRANLHFNNSRWGSCFLSSTSARLSKKPRRADANESNAIRPEIKREVDQLRGIVKL
jgi:hypothetical protein